MLTASQLHRRGVNPSARTYTFEASERDASEEEGGKRYYTFPIPNVSKLAVRLDVGGFATQSVEQNISSGENRVRWTEGLPITAGDRPTLVSGGEGDGVPIFSHELAIVEGVGDDAKVFKLGVVPRFNEVSCIWLVYDGTYMQKEHDPTHDFEFTSSSTGHPIWLSTTSNQYVNHRTYNHAVPHYGKVFQNFVAAGHVPDMTLDLVCAVTTERIDCLDPAIIDFSPVDTDTVATTYDTISNAASTMFTMDESKLTSALPDAVKMQSVADGMFVCSPWFVPDVVDFLNFQLRTVTDSRFRSSITQTLWVGSQMNCCHTTSARPSNGYRFEFVGGRVQLVRASGSTAFRIQGNTAAFGNYAYHSVQDTVGDGTNAVKTPAQESRPTCPTGHAPRLNHSLLHALGFRSTIAGEFTRDVSADFKGRRTTTTAYGLRADAEHAGIFETTIEPGYYSSQTLGDAVQRSMNLQRGAGSAASTNSPSAAFTFVDSTKVVRTAVITAGQRTPHQLAEAVCFVLNRLDARGLYSQTRENYTVHDGDAGFRSRELNDTVEVGQKLLWYRAVYDKDAKKFTIENREVSEHRFSSFDASYAYPYPTGASPADDDPLSGSGGYPTVQYPSTVSRAAFTISFKAADLQTGSAALGITPSTAIAARLLGFKPERAYTGAQLVSELEVNAASYPCVLTQGMLNDSTTNEAYSQRPLESAGTNGPYFYHNQPYFRGSGPDADTYPRFVYSVAGSEVNDKKYTVSARHPPVAVCAALRPFRNQATGQHYVDDLDLSVTKTTVSGVGDYVNAVGVSSGGDGYVGGTLAVVDDSNDGGPVVSVDGVTNGAVDTVSLVYRGSGATTLSSVEDAFQINADGPLRIVDGHQPVNTYATTANDGKDMSRIVVQCALATEDFGVYRTTQGHLSFQVGDFVELGGNCSVLLKGNNWGSYVTNHYFRVQRTTAGGAILQSSVNLSASAAHYTKLRIGQLYRVMQGDCNTVIRVRSEPGAADTTYEYDIVQHGKNHYSDNTIPLYGPIPPHITGVVEEIMQAPYRHEPDNVPKDKSAFQTRKTYRDPANADYSFTSSSLSRDGSLIKIRLAYDCVFDQAAYSPCEATNLFWIRNMDPVRFQLLNHDADVRTRFRRTDTAWNAFGLSDDSEIGQTVKMPAVWDLAPVSGIIMTLENDVGVEETHEYFTRGEKSGRVFAKVDYNSAVSRTWGVVHARTYTARNLKEIRVRLLDRYLRDYNFGGRSFTVSFNVHQF